MEVAVGVVPISTTTASERVTVAVKIGSVAVLVEVASGVATGSKLTTSERVTVRVELGSVAALVLLRWIRVMMLWVRNRNTL